MKKWIDQQLEPAAIEESSVPEARLKPLTTLTMSQTELAAEYPPPQLIRAYASGRLPLPANPERRAAIEQLVEGYSQRQAKADSARRMLKNASVEQRRAMLANIAPQQVVISDLLEQKLYLAVYSNR